MNKKYSKLCFLFLIMFAFVFVPFGGVNAYADENFTLIMNTTEFLSMSKNGQYKLASDLDFEGKEVKSIDLFEGIFDGNGLTIKNAIFVADSVDSGNGEANLGVFKKLNNAVVKNLQFLNVTVKSFSFSELSVSKAGIVAGEINNTKIENCSVISQNSADSSYVNVKSGSTVYAGGLVGELKNGSLISNCSVNGKIDAEQTSTGNINFYVGGIAGRISNSAIYNTINKCDIKVFANQSNSSFVGGVAGFAFGNRTYVKNNIFCGTIGNLNLQQFEGFIGSFIGKVSCLADVPERYSLNNFYTTNNIEFFGNINELSLATSIFKLDGLRMAKNIAFSNFCRTSFYTEENGRWNEQFVWNFNNVWILKEENISLPKLQNFELFVYTFSENASFVSVTKPILEDNAPVIIFNSDSSDLNFNFGDAILLEGQITTQNNLNNFFAISGLRKDTTNNIIYDNNFVLDIVKNGTEQNIDNRVIYTYGSDTVAVETAYGATSYYLNSGDIVWKHSIDANGYATDSYYLNNSSASMQGEYSFVLTPIKFKLTVSTESIDKGWVRRGTADISSKEEVITDYVSYGQIINYIAFGTEDYAFDKWILSKENDDEIESSGAVMLTFNENVFLQGGIFETLGVESEELTLLALYTKAVCQITFRFAINGVIQNENLASVYMGNVKLEQNEEGFYSNKVKINSKNNIKVDLPAGYEFMGWFESDGTNNLGDLSQSLEMEINANNENDSMMIVANFYKDESFDKNNSALIWTIIGSSAGLLVVVGVIIFAVKRGKDNSYKNYY